MWLFESKEQYFIYNLYDLGLIQVIINLLFFNKIILNVYSQNHAMRESNVSTNFILK